MQRDLLLVQSGGPTAVINATLAAALQQAVLAGCWTRLWGARHAYEALQPGLGTSGLVALDPVARDAEACDRLRLSPGSWLGSSRQPAQPDAIDDWLHRCPRPMDLLLIGGNGTSAVGRALAERWAGLPVGKAPRLAVAPKTIDNDIRAVAFAPGFASAAQFIAQATRDVGADHRAMATFDQVTIVETMGRDSGWLALAASGFRGQADEPPHLTLVPEFPLDEAALFQRIADCRARFGYAVIAINEALRLPDGSFYGGASITGPRDALGRPLFSLSSGTGHFLAERLRAALGLQVRVIRPGTLGRAASCAVTARDRRLAAAVGRAAVLHLGQPWGAVPLPPVLITSDASGQVDQQPLTSVDTRAKLITDGEYDPIALAPRASFLERLRPWLAAPLPLPPALPPALPLMAVPPN